MTDWVIFLLGMLGILMALTSLTFAFIVAVKLARQAIRRLLKQMPKPKPRQEKPKMSKEEHGSEEVKELDLESVEACFRYKADWVVDRISPRPALFICAELDTMSPPEETIATYEKCLEPKKLVFLPKARHNHIYEFSNSEHFQTAAEETTEWFRKYL